jgi:CDP-glycerol glycerophosphotransferase
VVNGDYDKNRIPKGKVIHSHGFEYYKEMFTAGFIVTNDRLPSELRFRKKQTLINTWHGGGAFKRTFGYPNGIKKWYSDKTTQLDSSRTSIFLSSSKVWSNVIARDSFHYKGEILESGFPRNDIFLKKEKQNLTAIKTIIGVSDDVDILLYAPTHRGSNLKASTIIHKYPIDLKLICSAWEKKYGKKCVVLFRGHHAMKEKNSFENVIDVSNYPDMQELILVSSMLITDYSSCMWDYALTYKPCYIYAPDFDEYLKEPGFESDYTKWPFIISKTNEELSNSIEQFEQDSYTRAVDDYLTSYGSYDHGNASEIVRRRIEEIAG